MNLQAAPSARRDASGLACAEQAAGDLNGQPGERGALSLRLSDGFGVERPERLIALGRLTGHDLVQIAV